MELVDSLDLGSNAKSVQVRVLSSAPKKQSPIRVAAFFEGGQDSNDLIATVRWTVADTSANTGGYLDFCPSPARAKMQTSPVARTKSLTLDDSSCIIEGCIFLPNCYNKDDSAIGNQAYTKGGHRNETKKLGFLALYTRCLAFVVCIIHCKSIHRRWRPNCQYPRCWKCIVFIC